VLLVVGEVVRLRDRLDWLGRPGASGVGR
jgi:hypothetical protein